MSSTLPFRCANDPKDFSLWDAHKDKFRKLFLTDGKSLGEVKIAMEQNGFPETNVKTYEVVLREHFKFRKNLEAGQWLLVGQELDRWKSQGLDCVVSLSGIEQNPRLVDRKVRRERTEAARGKLKYNKAQGFPEAVAIIPKVGSTLDTAGSATPNTIGPLESLFSLAQEEDPASATPSALISLSDPRLNPQQLFNDAHVVGLQAEFVDYILRNPNREVYETLGKNVPSRELISFLRGIWENTRLFSRERTILGEIIFGFINLMRNMPPFKKERLPDPRLFGLNDSFSVLETACTSLCNGIGGGFPPSLFRTMRKWLATVADIAVLKQFFNIPKPAVAAMWSTLIALSTDDPRVYTILIEVALRVHDGRWVHCAKERILRRVVSFGAESTTERVIESWQTTAGPVEPYAVIGALTRSYTIATIASVPLIVRLYSKLHAPQQLLDTTLASLFWRLGHSQAAAVHWLVQEGPKIQPGLSDWIPPCYQHLPSDWNPAWDPGPLVPEDFGVTFRGLEAPKMPCRNIFDTFLPFLGVLASARSGRDTLRRFMSRLSTDGHPERERLLRLALAETARRHDIETTKLLLETGMFINMGPFQRVPWTPTLRKISDPIRMSARKFDTEILRLLLSHKLFENYHVFDILMVMSDYCPAHERPKRQLTVDFLLERDRSSLKASWDEVSSTEYTTARDLIKDYVQRRISHQRAPRLEPRNLLCTIFPNDTLRETIKHGFGINAVESLVAAGIPIPSDPTGNENTLLIDALLTHSEDKYQIVRFLLRNGSDPRISSTNFTVLEATLRAQWGGLREDHLSRCRVSLDLVRELSRLGAPFKRQTTPGTQPPLPLLALLIRNFADISLLQQAVAGGAQINDFGMVPPWSALNIAMGMRQPETVKWLLKQGADVNACPTNDAISARYPYTSVTSLEYAVEYGDMDTVILLLSHGAIINKSSQRSTKNWMTGKVSRRLLNAVDVAASRGRLDILKVLVDSGGESAYPGLSRFDGTFREAGQRDHLGITMFLEQHTGWSWDSIRGSMKESLESGELW